MLGQMFVQLYPDPACSPMHGHFAQAYRDASPKEVQRETSPVRIAAVAYVGVAELLVYFSACSAQPFSSIREYSPEAKISKSNPRCSGSAKGVCPRWQWNIWSA